MERIRRLETSALTLTAGVLALALAGCAVEETGDATEGEAEAEATQPTAETQPTTPPEPAAPAIVPEGTTMVFRVDETVSTGSHEVGDAFTARLVEPALATDGSVALPAGTSSRWVVTRSEDDGGDEGQALLAFGLQSVDVGGAPTAIEATVTDTDIQSDAGDSTTESVAKVAVGAAAGALIGQILGGDTESTLRGAGVGAVVGTVVALTTGEGEARLAEGSTVTVRLDQDLPAG